MDRAPLHFRSHGFCDALLYNRERPHSSLGNLTPEEFAALAKEPASATLARTTGPAQERLAPALQGAPAAVPKPDSFSATLQRGEGWPEKLR